MRPHAPLLAFRARLRAVARPCADPHASVVGQQRIEFDRCMKAAGDDADAARAVREGEHRRPSRPRPAARATPHAADGPAEPCRRRAAAGDADADRRSRMPPTTAEPTDARTPTDEPSRRRAAGGRAHAGRARLRRHSTAPRATPIRTLPTPAALPAVSTTRGSATTGRCTASTTRSTAPSRGRWRSGYVKVVPRPLRLGVSNFFNNLGQPVSAVNALLQGKPKQAGQSLGRFVLNSTLGIGGIFDPASDAKLPQQSEDFGQTLGVWGWKRSRFVELPLFGPRTVRDTLRHGRRCAAEPVAPGRGGPRPHPAAGPAAGRRARAAAGDRQLPRRRRGRLRAGARRLDAAPQLPDLRRPHERRPRTKACPTTCATTPTRRCRWMRCR